MFLGIEIGGTKLQLGVGNGDGSPPAAVERRDIDPSRGSERILEQIQEAGQRLVQRHDVARIGIGFGGPVNSAGGRVIKSHQVSGWSDFPLADWCRQTFQLPTILGNDCDVAAVAEARFGTGRGQRVVFFVTVGTGIGGGLVIDECLYNFGLPAAAEIGHLRPGLNAERADLTVESVASGPGIQAAARKRLADLRGHPFVQPAQEAQQPKPQEDALDLLSRCAGDADCLTAKTVAEAAADGNRLALDVLDQGCQTLGWAIAQVITLIAPNVVVVGGGVALIGEPLFFQPLRQHVRRYVFQPLIDSYQIMPAKLGELVVVHGALALAAGYEEIA